MDTVLAYVLTGFAVICGLAGLVLFIYGLKTRITERMHCTLSTFAVVTDMLYDYDTNTRDREDSTPGTGVLYGPKLIVTIDDVKHEIFNDQYDSGYGKYKNGDVVPIMINPDNLNEYYINDGLPAGRFIYLVGLGLLVVAVFIIRYTWF